MQTKEILVTREGTSSAVELSDRERQILAFKEFSSSLGSKAKVQHEGSAQKVLVQQGSDDVGINSNGTDAATSINDEMQPPIWSPDPMSKFHDSKVRFQSENSVENAITYSCENPRRC